MVLKIVVNGAESARRVKRRLPITAKIEATAKRAGEKKPPAGREEQG